MIALRTSTTTAAPLQQLFCVAQRFVTIKGGEIRVGNVIEKEGRAYKVVNAQTVKPGKGGAYMQCDLVDIKTGSKGSQRYRTAEQVEKISFGPTQPYQYLYAEEDYLHVMHMESYEQTALPSALMGDRLPFLVEGMEIQVQDFQGEPFDVVMPTYANCVVEEADPNMKDATAAAQQKPAVLDNGVMIKVPQFVVVGDTIKVNIETQEYVERV